MKPFYSTAALMVWAWFAAPVLGESEFDVGRNSGGQIRIRADFPQPIVLDPSIFPGISGYAFPEPAFHAAFFDEPDQDFFQLSLAASVRLILLGKDPGMELWNDTGSGFVPVGGTYFIGEPIFDTHPMWNIVTASPGTIYTITVKLHDVNGLYSDSEPLTISFTPGQLVLNPANGHYYERIPLLPGMGIDWQTANDGASERYYQGVQGHLATITSQGEQNFIATRLGGIRGCWLGGSQQDGAAEPADGWSWITDEPWNFTNWTFGEPNDTRSYRGLNANENRLIIWTDGGAWNDAASVLADPNDTRGFIVEYDLPPAPVLNPATGHAYQLLFAPAGITWDAADAAARAMTHNGISGHLVTITSAAEQTFVTNTFGDLTGVWYGGFQPASSTEPGTGWSWVTGEPWNYTNWSSGEPNDNRGWYNGINEDRLVGWNGVGAWNDLADANVRDTVGYLVEFDPCSSFVAPDLDRDCDVDADDLTLFKACASRSSILYDPQNLPPGCIFIPDTSHRIAPDFNHDGAVDIDDFAVLQRCYRGTNHLANANCGD